MNVERTIPSEILNKIGSEYTLSGGTIRVAKGYEGAGKIVRHLIYPSDITSTENILNEIKSKLTKEVNNNVKNIVLDNNNILKSIQSFQKVSASLQGMNLVFSAAGFALVIHKLNKISQKIDKIDKNIDEINKKVDLILDKVNSIDTYQHRIQITNFLANLKSLEISLRTENKSEIYHLISELRKNQEFFISICDDYILTNNIKHLFLKIKEFTLYNKWVLVSSFAISNAFAQLDEIDEAKNTIISIECWQKTIEKTLRDTILKPTTPIWIGQLTHHQKKEIKESVYFISNTKNIFEYTKNTYEICINESLDIKDLNQNNNDLLVITPKK